MVEPKEDISFEELVEHALAALPDPFVERLDSVAIVIEDEPTADQLARLQVPGLYGLYEGIPRTRWGADAAPVPSKITIFRAPFERQYRDPLARASAVEDTVNHEIAHHFGISDARLHELRTGR